MNEAREILFSRDNNVIEEVSPTKGELRRYVPRSVLQFQSGDSLWVKTLMVGMLANGVGKQWKTK